MNLDWNNFFSTIFQPVVEFLQKEGLWDSALKIYYFFLEILRTLFTWIDANILTKNIWEFILTFLKFVVELVVVIFNVLVNIFHWIEALVK